MNFALNGIELAPLVVALVELAKLAGLPVQYARWVNAALSVGAYALVALVGQRPDLTEPVSMVLSALMIFLTAAGLYDSVLQPTLMRLRGA